MLGVVPLILAVSVDYAATISEATQRAVYTANGSRARIAQTNVVGRYATVLTSNGMMEGSENKAPLLLEHFAFGWQPLESLDFRCRLDVHGLSVHDNDRLMRGMPEPQDDRPCRAKNLRDLGPAAKVEAVRRTMHGPLVPSVVVLGTFALGEWYGAGGGQTLFEWETGRWHPLAGGGGALSSAQMRGFGVPKADWCRFGILDAACSRKR
jgi:hypothetical protein